MFNFYLGGFKFYCKAKNKSAKHLARKTKLLGLFKVCVDITFGVCYNLKKR